ncbi:MAG: type IV-A pilus assembly ATPase PilB [Nitrospirae bacterium]|nr:type IV-A pilus assembly ATPase PilB [Nitrospirota bacterium]
MSGRIGEMLLAAKLITEDQLKKALEVQQKERGNLGSNLIKLGYINEEKLTSFLSKQYGIPAINLSDYEIDPSVIKLIPSEVVRKYQVIPVMKTGAIVTIAMADPSNVFAVDDIRFMIGYNVETVIATESALKIAINKYYNQTDAVQTVIDSFNKDVFKISVEEEEEEEQVDIGELRKDIEKAPVVKLVNFILTDAISKGASDVHIEAYEKVFRVRYRIDGILYEIMQLPMRHRAALISRLKIMAELDIAERRLPQDGRIKLKIKGRDIDLRVSILPTMFGQKIVTRILDKGSFMLDITKLGFESKALKDFQEAISAPYGMILVTGPTGSGKTTTLYTALNSLNSVGVNIITAEDPIEYNFMGINQVQMKEEIGLNFATALRSFLRQDPDIIMVGEIRDYETAEIAVKAALTGHLVLSTLHTNDAPSTINRLLNMGIEPFLVASSTLLIMAQRLVRKICQNCKEEEKIPSQTLTDIGFSKDEAETIRCYRGRGCEVCNNTGYKGRTAIYEVMPMRDEIKKPILEGASAIEIKRMAVKFGMKTLRMSGLTKIKEGVSSVEEVVRVTLAE